MYRTWYSLLCYVKDSYYPDPDALPQLYSDIASIYQKFDSIKQQIELEQDINTKNDAKRAARILEEQIYHQIRYCIVCVNYKEVNDKNSSYSRAVETARRQFYADFGVYMPERVGFALFRIKSELGEVAIGEYVAVLGKDMEVMCDWQDMWPYYEYGDADVVVDWGM